MKIALNLIDKTLFRLQTALTSHTYNFNLIVLRGHANTVQLYVLRISLEFFLYFCYVYDCSCISAEKCSYKALF